MFYVYILKLSNDDYYHGYSNDLKHRLNQHERGENKSTSRFLPVELVNYVGFKSEHKARQFEEYLKTGFGYAFRNRHLI